jgi:pimeloyl-ACP methyl ester carboxylesterase
VSARDRLYLAAEVPTLLIWGQRDRMIPAGHGRAAHELMPGSRFLLYEKAGHFPHRDEPLRFAGDLLEFVGTTEPAEVDPRSVRELIQRGAGRGTV